MKWSVEQIAVLRASITVGDNVYLRLNEGAAPEKIVHIEEDELNAWVYPGSGSTYVRLSNLLDDDDLPALNRFFIMHPLLWKAQGIGCPKNLLASCKSAPQTGTCLQMSCHPWTVQRRSTDGLFYL